MSKKVNPNSPFKALEGLKEDMKKEKAFERMERSLVARERQERVKKGLIRTKNFCPPQMMVKENGKWCPVIGRS